MDRYCTENFIDTGKSVQGGAGLPYIWVKFGRNADSEDVLLIDLLGADISIDLILEMID